MLNVWSKWPEISGGPIASEGIDVGRRDCENAHLEAPRENQHELHAMLADEADRQTRSGDDESLRKTFTITGISEPFD
jgi:hypothetical protein